MNVNESPVTAWIRSAPVSAPVARGSAMRDGFEDDFDKTPQNHRKSQQNKTSEVVNL